MSGLPGGASVPSETLRLFIARLFTAGGFLPEEAERAADSLTDSSLRGHDSHGIIRCAEYVIDREKGRLVSGAKLEILHETGAMLAGDAGFGLGQVQMPRLLEKLETKARGAGIATGVLRHCGHAGRLGEWAEWAAGQKLASLVAVNDNGVFLSTAPPGGKAPRTSTNPIAFGIPLDGDSFVVDMSTSAVAFGKMRIARLAGERCAAGLIQDVEGLPSTDPNVLFEEPKGTLLPMGGAQGYKGFGLALMIDCLTAGLSGGYCPPAPENAPYANNVLCVLWDPERFSGLSHMQDQARKLLEFVRATPMQGGQDSVRLPGDRARRTYETRSREGIPLNAGLCASLKKLAQRLDVPLPSELEKNHA